MNKLAIWAVMFTAFCPLETVCAQSDKAKALLDEVHQKISKLSNLSITFEYKLDNLEEDIHQSMSGEAILKKDHYKFSFFGVTKMFDGKNIYTISPENEEISISSKNEYADDETNLTPSKMLTFYKNGYNYTWDILQKKANKNIQYILLNPTKPDSNVKKLLLGIDIDTKMVDNLIQINADGTKITIQIKSLKVNQQLPADTFIFNQKFYENKGYYIMKD